MLDIFFNTIIYLLLIGIGFAFKKKGILGAEAANHLMVLILNLTLPCLLITGSAGVEIRSEMVIYIFIGILINVVTLICSFLWIRKENTHLITGISMLASSGIDVGDFVLPFILTFLPGTGVMILCLFNIGNTIMNSGVNYAIASKYAAKENEQGEAFGLKEICKKLFSSATFDAYILILFMAITHLPWPKQFLQFSEVVGNANIFLVMIMIGLKLELSINKEDRKLVFQIIATRLLCALALATITIVLPFPTIAKVVLCAAYFGPTSALSNIFAKKLGYEGSVVSQVNVLTIFISIAIITSILMGTAGI